MLCNQQQQQQAPAAAGEPNAQLQRLAEATTQATAVALAGQQLALLQLYTAHVPVATDSVVALSCVYASPTSPTQQDSSDSSSSGGVAIGEASNPEGSTSAWAPCALWLMTVPETSGGGTQQDSNDAAAAAAARQATTSTAVAGAAAPAAAVTGRRVLHLPVDQQQQQQGGSSGPVLETSTVDLADVVVQLVQNAAAAAGGPQGIGNVVGSVQLVEQPPPPVGAAADGDTAASSSDAPASWVTPLPSEVGGWKWHQASWHIPVAAGSVIAGVGVAVPVGPRAVCLGC